MVCDFKNLKVWQKSMELAALIYRLSNHFPKSEIYGLTSQIRRAVISVSGNIAEGCGRSSRQDFMRFLHNAYGSIKETESYLMLASRLQYISNKDFCQVIEEIRFTSRMLFKLIKSLEKPS